MGIRDLMDNLPQQGTIEWLGIRPARLAPVEACELLEADALAGLVGDHYAGKSGKRQVTLIQAEHLAAVGSMLGGAPIEPATLRRNMVVSGLNLLALKGKEFIVGEATLAFTGLCHPCSRMEELLGAGGYNAMRGHGGITARVVNGGVIYIGSPLHSVGQQP